MKSIIKRYSTTFVLGWFFLSFPLLVLGQNPVISQAGDAIKSGNLKELVKLLNDRVDMNIDGSQQSYSSAQAEFVLKDFFQKNQPRNFEINHQGGQRDGILQYAIGSYASGNGNYRVVIRVRKVRDEYKIYNLDFSRE